MWKHNVPRCQGEGTLGRKSVRTYPTNCTLSLDVLHEKTQLTVLYNLMSSTHRDTPSSLNFSTPCSLQAETHLLRVLLFYKRREQQKELKHSVSHIFRDTLYLTLTHTGTETNTRTNCGKALATHLTNYTLSLYHSIIYPVH